MVRDQFHIKKNAAFKCPRPQCPLTERVDGISGNLVDQFQGKVQRLDSFLRLHLQQQRLQQVVLGVLVIAGDLCSNFHYGLVIAPPGEGTRPTSG